MAPKDKLVIDGTKPGEGGEIEVGHQPVQPGQTIMPQGGVPRQDNSQITQTYNQQSGSDYSNDQAGAAAGQALYQNNQQIQPQPTNQRAEQYTGAVPSTNQQLQPEHAPSPDQAGMYSTNPAYATQNSNFHPTKSVIGTPDNVDKVMVGNPNINNMPPGKNRKFSLKKTMLVLLPLLLIIGGAVYVLAFYLPNTPQNVWNTSIERTGKQVDAMVNKLNDKDALIAYEKTAIKVQGSLESGGQKYQINVDSYYDSTNSDTKAALQSDDAAGGIMQLEALIKTQLPDGAEFPNVYFSIKGLKDLGLDQYLGSIVNYDGKWIAVEQDYIKSLIAEEAGATQEEHAGLSYEDFAGIASDVNSVTQEYLFSSNPETSILVLKEFVGTEESEGITANHYKAGINGQNLKNWCNALTNKLMQNQAFKDLSGIAEDSLQQELEQQKQDCQDIDKDIKADNSFDLWMDKKNKIIHKIRIYQDPAKSYTQQINQTRKQADYNECLAINNGQDESCTGILASDLDTEQDLGTKYWEIGQIYKERNQITLFYNRVEETKALNSNTTLELTINTDNLAFDGSMNIVEKSEYSDYKLELSISTEPYSGDIDSAKPAGAIPIQQVLKEIFGTENPYADVQSTARDSIRQSNISSLHTGLEAYFVQYQTYPSYKQINDSEFRQEFLKGIPEETFSDPGAANAKLSDRVGVNTYSYVVVPSSCDGKNKTCDYYELSAKLEDGSTYIKQAVQ